MQVVSVPSCTVLIGRRVVTNRPGTNKASSVARHGQFMLVGGGFGDLLGIIAHEDLVHISRDLGTVACVGLIWLLVEGPNLHTYNFLLL